MSDNMPTVGQWLEALPAWKKVLFGVLCRVIGDDLAISVMGYHKAKWKGK